MIEKAFAFDIELLLRTELSRNDSIAKIPIAWIDSDEASTTTDLQPYLPMLKSAAAMYRRYPPTETSADQLANFLEAMQEEQWARLCERIPKAIAEADPATFSAERSVRLEELARGLS